MKAALTRIDQVVILAGGRGERLRPLTNDIPKPLVPVNGAPFLDYLIESLVAVGIRRILILLGYKAEMIMKRYRNSLSNGVQIEYSIGTVDDQTGRRLLKAYDMLDEFFLLLYGDNYWPIELTDMLKLYRQKNASVLTTVFSNKNGTGEYGAENNVEVGSDCFVKKYDKKRMSKGLNGVDIGYFIVNKSCLNSGAEGNISFEEDILTRLVLDRQVVAYITDTQYYYITDINSLRNLESFVIRQNVKPIQW